MTLKLKEMIPKFPAQIDFGKLKMDDIDAFNAYLSTLEGKKVNVAVGKYRKNRTDQSNRYLWGVCYKMIADETGYSIEDIHSLMKGMFLRKLVFIKNKKYDVIQSSATLDTNAFSEYIEKIKQFAATELSLNIPNPQEVVF